MTDRVLCAKDLQQEPYGFSRKVAYELLRRLGVRVSVRRIVLLQSRLESFLAGEEVVATNNNGNAGTASPRSDGPAGARTARR